MVWPIVPVSWLDAPGVVLGGGAILEKELA
jgi:hypothetical protein